MKTASFIFHFFYKSNTLIQLMEFYQEAVEISLPLLCLLVQQQFQLL